MDIGYWEKLMRISREYANRPEGEVHNWETVLLCTSRQSYIELLPMLLAAVHIKTSIPWTMMRLPEMLPPQHLNMIRNLEFSWDVWNTLFLESDALYLSDQLKYVPKPRFRFQFCGFVHPDRDKTNAVRLRAICEVLHAMQGLEVVLLHLRVISSSDPAKWDAQEAWIVNEINKARQARQGWKLTLRLFWLQEVSEENSDGLSLLRIPLMHKSD